jgi:endoglucanase
MARWASTKIALAVAGLSGVLGCSLTTSFEGFSSGKTPPKMAPGGYYVDGATIRKADGTPHLFHGLWALLPDNLYDRDWSAQFPLMKDWGATVVRITVSQDAWLKGAARYDANYEPTLDAQVRAIRALGMDVILCLSISDKGDLANQSPGSEQMPDQNSIPFWKQVAAKYKGDGGVIFQTYRIPYDVDWNVWRNGGQVTTAGFNAVGMQAIYDAIRGEGADNLIIANSRFWAFQVTDIAGYEIDGYNVAYGIEALSYDNYAPDRWKSSWGFAATTYPIVVFTFTTSSCDADYAKQFLAYADPLKVSWIAATWEVYATCDDSHLPNLIKDWQGGPTLLGQVVKTALQGY